MGHDFWKCNLSNKDAKILFPQDDNFWHDVVKAWSSYNFQHSLDRDQVIWYNSHLLSEGRPIFIRKAYEKGLMWISELFCNGQPISCHQASERYGLTVMQFNIIVSAIPQIMRREIRTNCENFVRSRKERYTEMLNMVNMSKKVYEELVDDYFLLIQKCSAWEKDLDAIIPYDEYLSHFKKISRITNVVKLRSFQYRWLIQAISTNIHLHKWRIRDDNLCSFCGTEAKSYIHLIYECELVQRIWDEVKTELKKITDEELFFSRETIVWNNVSNRVCSVGNTVVLYVKQYIYRKRCESSHLSMQEVRRGIYELKRLERFEAEKNRKLHRHYRKWEPHTDFNELYPNNI